MIFSSISLTSLKSDSDCILIRFPPERTFSASYREGGSSQPCKKLSRPLCNPGFPKMYPTFLLGVWTTAMEELDSLADCSVTMFHHRICSQNSFLERTRTVNLQNTRNSFRKDLFCGLMRNLDKWTNSRGQNIAHATYHVFLNGKQQNSNGVWQQNTRSQNSAPNTSCSILQWYCIARLAVNATGWKAFFTKAASIYRSFRLFILRNNNSQLIAYSVLRWMSTTIFIL